MGVIVVRNLSKSFGKGAGRKDALKKYFLRNL